MLEMMTAARAHSLNGPKLTTLLSSAGTMKVAGRQPLMWMFGDTIYIGQPTQTTPGTTRRLQDPYTGAARILWGSGRSYPLNAANA